MKNAILLISLFVAALAVNAQTPAAPLNADVPVFKFENEYIDYGLIQQYNANSNREFKFINTGKAPLIITNAVTSANYVFVEWPKQPVLPGAEGIIYVHYPTERVGFFVQRITLTSNAATSEKILTIKGNVESYGAYAAKQKTGITPMHLRNQNPK